MGGVDVRGEQPEPSELRRPPDPGAGHGAAGGQPGDHGVTAKHIRGSTLFLFGRGLSMAANFFVQVLIVRYLPTDAYGALAYALSFVNLGETLVTLGIDRAVGRFLPIYEERGQWGRLFGTIFLVLGTIAGLGLLLVVLVVGLQDVLLGVLIDDSRAVGLVVILAVLAPIQALDTVHTTLFAVFASPRTIFMRRYVLTPVLRITIAILLIAGGFGVE
ncbi:MAG: oligosaccharide flippase family protein, partial [Chloroflexi bacterium]|nr:oligosaccharide flippase family protein [Chloroflexota bacterium]